MNVRIATIDDIDLLLQLRMDYLKEDFGAISESDRTVIERQLISYYSRHLADGTFLAGIAEINGEAASTAFLAIAEKPANPNFVTGRAGTLLNVLTYPRFRRQGIATKVIERLIDEAKRLQVSAIDLSATPDGMPLYEKLGFHVHHYPAMRLKL